MGDADIWVQDDEENLVKQMVKYKDLMNKEYSFCLKIAGGLIKKANRLYKSQVTTGKVKKFCCDFKLLEQVCDTYVI